MILPSTNGTIYFRAENSHISILAKKYILTSLNSSCVFEFPVNWKWKQGLLLGTKSKMTSLNGSVTQTTIIDHLEKNDADIVMIDFWWISKYDLTMENISLNLQTAFRIFLCLTMTTNTCAHLVSKLNLIEFWLNSS